MNILSRSRPVREGRESSELQKPELQLMWNCTSCPDLIVVLYSRMPDLRFLELSFVYIRK